MVNGSNGTKRGRPPFAAGGRAQPAAPPLVRQVALAALGLIAGAGIVGVGSLLVPVPVHQADSRYAAPVISNDEPQRVTREGAPAERMDRDSAAARRATDAAQEEPRKEPHSTRHVAQDQAAPAGQDQDSAALKGDPPPAVEPSGATGALHKNGAGEASSFQNENGEQAASRARDEKSDEAAQGPARSTAALGDKPSEPEKLPSVVAPVERPPHRAVTPDNDGAPAVKSRQASRSFTVEEPPAQARPAKHPGNDRSLRRSKVREPLWRPPARTMRATRRGRLALEDRAWARRPRPRAAEEIVIIDGPEAARVYHVIVPRYERRR